MDIQQLITNIHNMANDVAKSGKCAMFIAVVPTDGGDASVSRVLPHTPTGNEKLTEQQLKENAVMVSALADVAIQWLPVKEYLLASGQVQLAATKEDSNSVQ